MLVTQDPKQKLAMLTYAEMGKSITLQRSVCSKSCPASWRLFKAVGGYSVLMVRS